MMVYVSPLYAGFFYAFSGLYTLKTVTVGITALAGCSAAADRFCSCGSAFGPGCVLAAAGFIRIAFIALPYVIADLTDFSSIQIEEGWLGNFQVDFRSDSQCCCKRNRTAVFGADRGKNRIQQGSTGIKVEYQIRGDAGSLTWDFHAVHGKIITSGYYDTFVFTARNGLQA
jgi:hypothetical protein